MKSLLLIYTFNQHMTGSFACITLLNPCDNLMIDIATHFKN